MSIFYSSDENRMIIPVCISSFDLQIASSLDKRTDEWIVLLHGLQSNQKMYDDLRKQDFLKSYSVLSLDFLGFGKSSHQDDLQYTLAEQCEALIQVLENLKIKDYIVVGHSFGGMVGTLLLDRLKNRISGLINLEGNLLFEHCGASRLIAEKYNEEQFVAFGFKEFLAEIAKETGTSMPYRLKWLREASVKALYRTAQSIVAISKSGLDKIWAQRTQNQFYICGSQNKDRYKGVADFLIQDAGHFMLIDNPRGCYSTLSEIFRKLRFHHTPSLPNRKP